MIKSCLLLITLSLIYAVRRHDFKTCSESAFCNRNRYLARNHMDRKAEGLRFDIDYEIKQGSIYKIPGGVAFTIGSMFEQSAFLKGEIIMYKSGTLHSFIDEIEPIHERFRTTDILNQKEQQQIRDESVKFDNDRIIFKTGKYRYEITYKPFVIEGYYNEKLTIKVNGESLMNFERYRNLDDDLKPSDQNKVMDQPIKIFDAAGVYLEKNGELESAEGLWKEKWKSWTDEKKRGPSSVAIDVEYQDATHVYGLPEHADSLALKDTYNEAHPYRLYNLDVFEFELNERMALYGSVPFVVSRTTDLKSSGFFWLNPSETWVDIETKPNSKFTHWISESGVMEFFIFLGESPIEIIEKFTLLTGPPQLPPLFSLAYHQCRWNYNSQEDLLEVNQGYEKNNIPVDVFWLDIEHTPDRKYFNWDYSKFPNPVQMQDELASKGRKLVTIVDPHIKRADDYSTHQECKQGWYSAFISLFQSSGIYLFRILYQGRTWQRFRWTLLAWQLIMA